MISFMQKLINKHHKVLFSVLLVVIIIAFVFTGAPGIGYKQKKARMFYGFNLSSQKDINNMVFSTQLTAELEGESFQNMEQLEHAVFSRLVALDLSKKLHIPTPTDEQVKQYIEHLPAFLEDQKFSNTKYNNLITALQANGKSAIELRKFFNENIKIQYALQSLGGTGIVFDHQTIESIQVIKTSWDFSVCKLDSKDFQENLEITDADLEAFFKEHEKHYVSPMQFKVSYITFDTKNFAKEVAKPSKDDLNNFYTNNKELFENVEGKENTQKAIVTEYYNEKSLELAQTESEKVVSNLVSNDILLNTKEAADIIKEANCTITDLAPYSLLNLPKIEGLDEKILTQVQSLDMNQRYSEPITVNNKIIVLYLADVVSGSQMTFDEAKKHIEADVKIIKTHQAFIKYGETIKEELISKLSAKKSIENIANKYKLDIENYTDITIENNNKDIPFQYFGVLSSMKDEKVQMLLNEEQIIFICVKNKIDPDLSKISVKDKNIMKSQLSELYVNLFIRSELEQMIAQGLQTLKE